MASKKGAELLKYVSEYISKCKSFDSTMRKLRVIEGGDGCCICEFKVSEKHLNQQGGLHGGFTATIVDNVTTYALMTKSGIPGVSVDIHVSYMKGAREGDDVIVDAQTVRVGKTLAYLACELRHKSDNSIIAQGTQTKFVALPTK